MAGGYPRIYSLFEKVRAENPGRTIAVDCGDCFHGNAVATMSKGEALIPILNHLQYAPVVESGSFGSFVGRVDLVLEDGQVKDYLYQLIEVSPDDYQEEPSMRRIVDKVREPYLSGLEKKIGSTSTPLYRYSVLETPMDNLITDAMRETVQADLAVSQAFRFSPPILPGPITEENLSNMLPHDAKLKYGVATGKQIWEWMEDELELIFQPKSLAWVVRFSGMSVECLAGNQKGSRVAKMTINGEPIDFDREYKIVSFEREGEPHDMVYKLQNVKHAEVLSFTIHQAIRDFLAKHSPVS